MKINEILKVIKANSTFLLSAHENLDADAMTSELVMAAYLRKLGKKVYIINHSPVPSRLKFLPGANNIKQYKKGMRVGYDVLIVVDCGELRRIGDVRYLLLKDKKIISFDHHATNHYFADYNVVDQYSSSTAEIVYEFLTNAGFKLNRTMAMLLYSGIITDTGCFRYSNTSAKTHLIVSELRGYNFPAHVIYKKLFEVIPTDETKGFLRTISRHTTCFNNQVLLIELKKKIFNKFSEDFDLRDSIFSFFRTVKGLEVVAILSEVKHNVTKINLRSMGAIDVAKLANVFDGGGHKAASGCVIKAKIKEASKILLKEIKRHL